MLNATSISSAASPSSSAFIINNNNNIQATTDSYPLPTDSYRHSPYVMSDTLHDHFPSSVVSQPHDKAHGLTAAGPGVPVRRELCVLVDGDGAGGRTTGAQHSL